MDVIRDRVLTGGGRRIVCQHEWRHDFVGEALTIDLDETAGIIKVEFYSAAHGIVSWLAGRGLGPARRWEETTEVADEGAFSVIYKAALLTACRDDRVSAAIIDEVLSHVAQTPLADVISRSLVAPAERHVLEQDLLDDALPPRARPAVAPPETPAAPASSFVGRLLGALARRRETTD